MSEYADVLNGSDHADVLKVPVPRVNLPDASLSDNGVIHRWEQESPYTGEHEDKFCRAMRQAGLSGVGAGGVLRELHRAGITVTFPQPRFYAERATSYHESWVVCDRHEKRGHRDAVVASFWKGTDVASDHPDPEGSARAETDRLNREATP
jgi:hypothetical protein